MLIGYSRVSTDDQYTAAQVAALKAAGWERIFRLTMLSTIGFGDITPPTLPMQRCEGTESLRGESH